jgi:hypothetical protein
MWKWYVILEAHDKVPMMNVHFSNAGIQAASAFTVRKGLAPGSPAAIAFINALVTAIELWSNTLNQPGQPTQNLLGAFVVNFNFVPVGAAVFSSLALSVVVTVDIANYVPGAPAAGIPGGTMTVKDIR